MPKLKDFLRKVAEQVKITDSDFEAVLSSSAIAELEVTDEFVSKFNGAYLTRERAENDPEIIKKLNSKSKSEVLDGVDQNLKTIMELLPKDKADLISKETNTYERIKLLRPALEESFNSSKTNREKELEKSDKEWADKLKAEKEAHALELKKVFDDYGNKQLRWSLKHKIMGYTFSDAYSSVKESTANVILDALMNYTYDGNPVKYLIDESTGRVNVKQETEGSLRDIYTNGNERLTVDNILDPIIEPFTKKADPNPNNGAGGDQQKKTVTAPADVSKMSLQEIRRHQAALNGQ